MVVLKVGDPDGGIKGTTHMCELLQQVFDEKTEAMGLHMYC